jgi:hypothetical protein
MSPKASQKRRWSVDTKPLRRTCTLRDHRGPPPAQGANKVTADQLTPNEKNSLLRIADGADAQDDVEEAAVSRLQSLELIEQRGVSFGLTLRGVRKVAQLN